MASWSTAASGEEVTQIGEQRWPVLTNLAHLGLLLSNAAKRPPARHLQSAETVPCQNAETDPLGGDPGREGRMRVLLRWK